MKSHRDYKKEVLHYMKKNKVAVIKEVSDALKISWNTAEKYLVQLELEGRIQRVKKVGINIWVYVKNG